MSWFKSALIEIDFEQRNLINNKIRYLQGVKEQLPQLAKVVFQSAVTAKSANFDILNSKKLSSYPLIRDILIDADAAALDSPWRFAGFCIEAVDVIDDKLIQLKKERDDLFKGNKSNVEKGWV